MENAVRTCPGCGVSADAAPSPRTSDVPPKRDRVGDTLQDFAEFTGGIGALVQALVMVPYVMLAMIPVALLGAVGYWLGDAVGAAVAVIGGMVVFLAIQSWREHRREPR